MSSGGVVPGQECFARGTLALFRLVPAVESDVLLLMLFGGEGPDKGCGEGPDKVFGCFSLFRRHCPRHGPHVLLASGGFVPGSECSGHDSFLRSSVCHDVHKMFTFPIAHQLCVLRNLCTQVYHCAVYWRHCPQQRTHGTRARLRWMCMQHLFTVRAYHSVRIAQSGVARC